MNDSKTVPPQAGQAAPAATTTRPQPATPATGQKVSQERGSATHKKNPGKRPKQGG